MLRPLILALLLALAWPVGALAQAHDPEELERTWQAAWVFLPTADEEGYRRIAAADLPDALAGLEAPLPALVYGHGCAGHYRASDVTGAFLARAGYLVVMPDGFAREEKPTSCIPEKKLGGLHRAVLSWRHAELGYAIERLRALEQVRADAIFLMGFSEGGIAAATFSATPVAGRIVEGWTCHAGWPEYRGLMSPADEPLLTLVAAEDPWFQLPILRGDCGAFMQDRPQSRSMVVEEPPQLAVSHWLTKDEALQQEVLRFLASNTPN